MKITGDMKVCDVLNLNEEMELIFEEYGLLCRKLCMKRQRDMVLT